MNKDGFSLLEVLLVIIVVSIILARSLDLAGLNIKGLARKEAYREKFNIKRDLVETIKSVGSSKRQEAYKNIDISKLVYEFRNYDRVSREFELEEGYRILISKEDRGERLWVLKLSLEEAGNYNEETEFYIYNGK